MKRRHFSRNNSFIRVKRGAAGGGGGGGGRDDGEQQHNAVENENDNCNDSYNDNDKNSRVSLLSDSAKASVRAGQVIGSLSRAIEELVRNSVLHGRATVVDIKVGSVKFARSDTKDNNGNGNISSSGSSSGIHGRRRDTFTPTVSASTSATMTLLEVKDNGTGIDAYSTQTLIGTEHCSSSFSSSSSSSNEHVDVEGTGPTQNKTNCQGGREKGMNCCGDLITQQSQNTNSTSLKGETLKSLAALSVEFRVLTASLIRETSVNANAKVATNVVTNVATNVAASLSSSVNNDRQLERDLVLTRQRQRTYAPSKSKLRKRYPTSTTNIHETKSSSRSSRGSSSSMILCEKIIRQGNSNDISFKSSTLKKSESPFIMEPLQGPVENNCTGTIIQVYGLFHGFAVRKRQYDINNNMQSQLQSQLQSQSLHDMKNNNLSVDRAKLTQARYSIQILAMAFPHVSIRLMDAASNVVYASWPSLTLLNHRRRHYNHTHNQVQAPSLSLSLPSSSSLHPRSGFPFTTTNTSKDLNFDNVNKQSMIRNRLHQLCGEKIASTSSFIDVNFVEDNKQQYQRKRSASLDNISYSTKSSSSSSSSSFLYPSTFTASLRNSWKVDGVICCMDSVEGGKSIVGKVVNRSRQQELIFVNGQLSKQNSVFGDLIHKWFSSSSCCSSSGFNTKGSIVSFLLHITCPPNDVELVLDETRSYSYIRQRRRLDVFIHNALKATLNDDGGSNVDSPGRRLMVPENDYTPHSSLRLVSSKKISTSKKESLARINSTEGEKEAFESPQSPFSSAFFEDSKLELVNHVEPMSIVKSTHEKESNIDSTKTSNEATKSRDTHDVTNGMQWTRTRVKALESQIRSLANTTQSGGEGINISKAMLSKAEFIAQLASKFIIVKMNGVICAVDQHAADERIGLEKLENAIYSKVSLESDENKNDLLNLSKKDGISTDELIKYVPLQEVKVIHLSATQLETVRAQKQIINSWKFNFILNKGASQITLIGVPGVCERTATSNDFIQFLQAIEKRTSDVNLVTPAFVKRALASYACRYAIMFGDVLADEKCKEIISELSKCHMCFICAHGRPSVVPLIDLTLTEQNEIEHKQKNVIPGHSQDEYVPLRFRQRITKRIKRQT